MTSINIRNFQSTRKSFDYTFGKSIVHELISRHNEFEIQSLNHMRTRNSPSEVMKKGLERKMVESANFINVRENFHSDYLSAVLEIPVPFSRAHENTGGGSNFRHW